jgi:hypothetical protein
MHGEPRTLVHQRLVDRHVLASRFAKDKETRASVLDETKTPRATFDSHRTGYDAFADQVVVVEAWHLPSYEGADDGSHAIVTEHATLLSESWGDAFPFVFFHWSRPQVGFWGSSLVEEVQGLQLEMNELMGKIQTAFWHLAVPWVFNEVGSKIEKAHLNNDMKGSIIDYSGTMPQVHTHATVHPEVFQHLDRLYSRAYEVSGISQMSAQGVKPAGLNSGKAQLVYEDIESERFQIKGQDYERGAMKLAWLMVEAAKRLDEAGFDVEVSAEDRRRRRSFLQRIKWSDVDLGDEAFELKIFPSSALPQTPAGRLATVEQLIASGMIDRDAGMQLLDFPDIDSVTSRELAPYDVALDIVEMILDDGEVMSPEPFMNLELSMKIVNQAYLRAKIDRVPEDRLQMLRVWVSQAQSLLTPPAPPTAAPPVEAVPPNGGGQPMLPPDAMVAGMAA